MLSIASSTASPMSAFFLLMSAMIRRFIENVYLIPCSTHTCPTILSTSQMHPKPKPIAAVVTWLAQPSGSKIAKPSTEPSMRYVM